MGPGAMISGTRRGCAGLGGLAVSAGALSPPLAILYGYAMAIACVFPFRPLRRVLMAAAICFSAGAQPAAGQGRPGLVSFERQPLTIVSAGAAHSFSVEMSRTRQQHEQGLMHRRRMARNAGMLFLYPRVAPIEMWMKNTLIPLDMLFFDSGGIIVTIAERTVPRSLETISSGQAVMGVLELNGGMVSRLKIRIGDRLKHPAFDAAK